MAHTCPDCGSYCTCHADWDDMDMGEWIGCEHYERCEQEADEADDYIEGE